MTPNDFDFALEMTEREQWGFSERDLGRMLWLEPKGCFVVLADGVRVGLCTTVAYGKDLGWIGNVIVGPSHRRRGVGATLVNAAIKHLRESKVKRVGLYSYRETSRFYTNLGFVAASTFIRLSRATGSEVEGNCPTLREADLDSVLALDTRLFRADRGRLLRRLWEEFPDLWFVASKGPKVVGYAFVKPYTDSSEIGPWACRPEFPALGEQLLKTAMANAPKWPIEVGVSAQNSHALGLLEKHKFTTLRTGLTMYSGRRINARDSDGILGMGFLDKG